MRDADHVHLLFEPQIKDEGAAGEVIFWSLSEILHGIKSSTAHRINKLRNATGPVWEKESFDRLIRSESDLEEKFSYICRNPWDSNVIDQKRRLSVAVDARTVFGGGAEDCTRGACVPQAMKLGPRSLMRQCF